MLQIKVVSRVHKSCTELSLYSVLKAVLFCYCLLHQLGIEVLLYIWLDRENTHSLARYQETLQLVTSQMSVNTCSSQLKWQWHDSCLQFQVRYFKIHLGFLVLPTQMTVHYTMTDEECTMQQKCPLQDAPKAVCVCTVWCADKEVCLVHIL